MAELIETTLRKSLNAADRRRKAMTVLTITLAVAACFVMLTMNSVRDLRLQLIAGFTGLAFLICAIGIANMAISYRNTAAILKTIGLISKTEQ